MKYKVGDKVVLLDNWSDAEVSPEDIGKVYTISNMYPCMYRGKETTRIEFSNGEMWAEPHEIRTLTPLEKAMK